MSWMEGLAADGAAMGAAAREQAERATKSALVNKMPGAGLLFNHDLDDGFQFTPLGLALAVGLAGYGALKLIGGR